MIFLAGFAWLIERLFRLVGVDKHYAQENAVALGAAIVPGAIVGLIAGLFILGVTVGLMRLFFGFDTDDHTYRAFMFWWFTSSVIIGYLFMVWYIWRQRKEPPKKEPTT